MAKIHVLVPNQELADYALQIIAEEKMDSCQVEVIRYRRRAMQLGRVPM
mgnify:CR=1 FL=1